MQCVAVKQIPLEDTVADVLGKAQRGLKISDDDLARKAEISTADLARVKGGEFDESIVGKLAEPLNLRASALAESGKKAWYPATQDNIPGLACFNTPYEDMTVNSYLIWDPKTNNGACFDTGADASGMTRFASERGIRIQMVLLTHTHPDHIADLERLKAATGSQAFVCKLEAIAGAETFDAGRKFTVGSLSVETRQTIGHSRGGITYVVNGLPNRIAVVGDAMFAGSMGGGAVSYADAIRTNCSELLTLPDDTILCPGHGPLTTVGEQKIHNPFFPNV
jgi:glyoxylase-like metal-dependent hydrolase (beta-lactamase superfamily II)